MASCFAIRLYTCCFELNSICFEIYIRCIDSFYITKNLVFGPFTSCSCQFIFLVKCEMQYVSNLRICMATILNQNKTAHICIDQNLQHSRPSSEDYLVGAGHS